MVAASKLFSAGCRLIGAVVLTSGLLVILHPVISAADPCPEGDVGDIDLSCGGLWRERNRVLAEHGYCFQKERTIRVFGRGCFPPYGQLSNSDRCYVEAIQKLERAKNCTRR